MTKKPQRSGVNSVTSAAKSFAVALEDVPVPDGVELRSDEEKVLWRQFSRARAREDWRDMDLILLSKIVKLEADIRKNQGMIDRSGVLIKNERGTLHENPLLRVVDTLERRQLAVIRSLSLTQTASDPRTINAQAVNEDKARQIMKEQGVETLLAMPH